MSKMADPKYSNLPGIAYDQPDVYETHDLPEADQIKEEPEDVESESIDYININAGNSFSKFKDKQLSSEKVDFSDRLGRKSRTGYGISGEWQLVPCKEDETPLQKYQRLKCELKELVEEIANIREKDKESKEIPDVNLVSYLEVMNRQLEELSLDKSLGTEVPSNLSDPQGAQIKKMIAELIKLSSSGLDSKSEGKTELAEGQSCEIKYKINAKPHQVHLGPSARIADLEARVKRLNAIVAGAPDTLRRIGGGGDRSLAETSHWVAGKVALLDVTLLEGIDSRMTSLLTKLDQLAEKSTAITGSSDADMDNKIFELYELAKTTEEMSQVLPKALDRMVALQALHQQGAGFVKSLSEVESMQQALSNSCENTKEALKRMEENFMSSIKGVKQSLEDMDNRVKAAADAKKKK